MNLPRKPARRRYTVKQFMRSSLTEAYRYELVNGRLLVRAALYIREGLILSNLITHLACFWKDTNGSVQFLLPVCHLLEIPDATGDNIRIPELTIAPRAKMDRLNDGPVTFVPDIAVELNLEDYETDYLPNKFLDYQKAGWDTVWLIYTANEEENKSGKVEIYQLQEESGLQPAQVLNQSDTLVSEGILEGFTMAVQELFV